MTPNEDVSSSERVYADGDVVVHHGDCLEVMRSLPDSSLDAVVTDPPYGLEFMGKDWDSFGREGARSNATAGMTPTGFADGYTRLPPPTFLGGLNPRCTACGKSQRGGSPCRCERPNFTDERGPRLRVFQSWCEEWARECLRVLKPGGYLLAFGGSRTSHRLTAGIEDAGFEIRDGMVWLYGSGFPKSRNVGEGKGTALKPANEPITVARKPLSGTVAANVLAHGTGAINIDACRTNPGTPTTGGGGWAAHQVDATDGWNRPYVAGASKTEGHDLGRWPTNVVLTHSHWCETDCWPGCPVAEVDEQSGASTSRIGKPRKGAAGDGWRTTATGAEYADSGGASRFFPTFRYEAKAATAERPRVDGVAHPTVKPLGLMRWLVRLVTPPGGTVLEPFAGSGTTAEACVLEGLKCIAIERDESYLPLIEARLAKPLQPSLDLFAGGLS